MKKLIFIFSSLFMGQALFAMEHGQKPKLSQKKRDELGKNLIEEIFHFPISSLKNLIEEGANLNYISLDPKTRCIFHISALMSLASFRKEDKHQLFGSCKKHLEFLSYLIEKGADINLLNRKKKNALFFALSGQNSKVVKLLLDAGINPYRRDAKGNTPLYKYLPDWDDEESLPCVQVMLDNAVQLSPNEKKFLKTWALVNNRLRNEGRGLVKYIEKVIALHVIRSFAFDACNRVEKLGWNKELIEECKATRAAARKAARNDFAHLVPELMDSPADNNARFDLVEKYLDLTFLEKQVKKQCFQEFNAELIEDSK